MWMPSAWSEMVSTLPGRLTKGGRGVQRATGQQARAQVGFSAAPSARLRPATDVQFGEARHGAGEAHRALRVRNSHPLRTRAVSLGLSS